MTPTTPSGTTPVAHYSSLGVELRDHGATVDPESYSIDPCSACDGTGKAIVRMDSGYPVAVRPWDPEHDRYVAPEECPDCRGTGGAS